MARGRSWFADLHPVDWVHAGFYAFVLALSLARFPTLPNPVGTFVWYGSALVVTLAIARGCRGATGWGAVVPRTVFTVVVAPITFLRLGDVVPYVNPHHREEILYRIDNALFFGANPNVLLDGIAWPPLTELLQIVYSLYYFMPIVLFVYLVRARKAEATSRALFLVLLCLYASYVGYFAVPATGPNVNVLGLFPPHFAGPMPGLWLADDIRTALFEAESIKHDCWPSGHTAVAVTTLWIAWQESSAAFRVLVVPVVLLVFSTMYLRYHYVVDVVFGLALAWAVMRFGPRLYDALSGARSPSPRAA